MHQLHKQYSEDMQRVNQQWSNLFWKTSIGQQSERHEQKQEQQERSHLCLLTCITTARKYRIL